jgi:hypothetical protein
MNPLNSQIMEKDTEKKEVIKREVTTLEIAYHKREELLKLSNSDEFVDFIIDDSYKTIKKAIADGLEKVELFNILNLSIIIELERKNFRKVLNKIIQHYIGYEEYEKCSEIQKLKKKI